MSRQQFSLVLVAVVISGLVSVVSCLDFFPTIHAAQEATVRDRLVGAWNLVSWETRHNDGTTTLPFGGKAVGRILYTADGYMSAQLMEDGRPPCTATSIFSCTLDQLETAASGYLGYTGKFTVQEDRRTVTHHVVVAFNPGRVGTDQVRQRISLGKQAAIDGSHRKRDGCAGVDARGRVIDSYTLHGTGLNNALLGRYLAGPPSLSSLIPQDPSPSVA